MGPKIDPLLSLDKILGNITNKLGVESGALQKALQQLPKKIDTYKTVTVANDAVVGLKALENGRMALPKTQTNIAKTVEKLVEKPVVAATKGKVGQSVEKGLLGSLKIAKGGRIVALGTNTLFELSKAVNLDYQKGTFTHTPKALAKETCGWVGATIMSGAAMVLSRNPAITESAGLAGYSLGAHVGNTYISDTGKLIHGLLADPHEEFSKKLMSGLLLSTTFAAAPYLYARLEDNGWL